MHRLPHVSNFISLYSVNGHETRMVIFSMRLAPLSGEGSGEGHSKKIYSLSSITTKPSDIRTCPYVTEMQLFIRWVLFVLWKIFISLLKSTCGFEKERYFRTPIFRKEKR